ncbi:hypothetical protein H8F23_07320 [Pseudomonas sp. P155]|uniref:Uncharacterized protein n=1 Tax=Pseudomonas neuropathica TaxID=2730425 RepID=A0ABS0BIK9_9PSED|nr:hypothetical protein [Pseudomonas neuropathica]MBF6033055.1 hypothetical protein [Pseudomonas neuropathica]
MENLNLVMTENGLNLLGITDAVKLVEIDHPLAKRVADLYLHKIDIEFSNSCLDAINRTEDQIIREALWRSAVIHFFKCFGDGIRFLLMSDQIYKGLPKEANESFKYFKLLRNKHIAHDENPYNQCLSCAAINDGGKDYHVEKIVCISSTSSTLDASHWSSLKALTDRALEWITLEFDISCEKLTKILEKETYEQITSKPSPHVTAPTAREIGDRRKI